TSERKCNSKTNCSILRYRPIVHDGPSASGKAMNVAMKRAQERAETRTRPMRHLTAAADRIDYWIRRHIVPCGTPSNAIPKRDKYVALTAIGQSLRDQYDALAAPVPPHLAALVKQLEAR